MQSELIWNDSVHILKPGREQANVNMWEKLYKEVRLLKYYQEENGYFFPLSLLEN